ncbi:MAG: cytochrome P450 [Schumannella sp.]
MAALRAQFEVFVAELVESVLERGSVDGVCDIAEVLPIRVFGDAVGIPREGRAENLLPHGAMNFSTFGPRDARYEEYFRKGEKTHEWVMNNCARENLVPGGLGSQIWELADAGEITADQAALLVRALLSAGLDSTVIAIGNVLRECLRYPEEWARVVERPDLAKFAIDETLRHESPFQSFFRTTSREVGIAGLTLPAETKVLLFIGSANRDRERWGDDADLFDVGRQAGGHLAFGMGIHQCVGQPISRLEMDVLFTELARRKVTFEQTGDPVPYLHNTLKG